MNPEMKTKTSLIRIAVVETDPLRFVGFKALLGSERDLELIFASAREIESVPNVDIVLLSNRANGDTFDEVANLRASRPDRHIIATGSGMSDNTILAAIAAGAKGYVDEAASAAEFIQAIRTVHQGLVWASRRILSKFVERASHVAGRISPVRSEPLTRREKEVLTMLVQGQSNKEIARPLGIEERTVKAHISKLMRKTGVRNRVALSTYAIEHAIVS